MLFLDRIMEEDVQSRCGVFLSHTLHDTYSGLKGLEHRGREATGIAGVRHNGRIDAIKFAGPPRKIGIEDLHYIFPGNDYHTFFGHVRYATRGRKDRILQDAHPHVIGGRVLDRGSHVIILDAEMAAVHNGQISPEYFGRIDRSQLKTGCDTEAALHLYREIGARGILKEVPGSYVMIIADGRSKDVILLRDKMGVKPAVLGWKDGKYVASSEDIALREIGANFVEAVRPGTITYFEPEGGHRVERVVDPVLRRCFFDWSYISNVNSMFDGVSVDTMRTFLGESLADEFKSPIKDVDVVTFLPRCPEKAAASLARKSGKPFEKMFYKLIGERSFQGSDADERAQSIESNLFLLPRINGQDSRDYLHGKTALVVDDSTIRGNNSKRGVKLLLEGGAERVILMNYTPKMCGYGPDGKKRGCELGVDMPIEPAKGDKYIARGSGRNRTDEEIGKRLGFETHFLSLDGMLRAFERAGISRESLCTFCVGGKDPLGIS